MLYILWRSSARSLQAFAHDHELLLCASLTTFFRISYEASVFRICLRIHSWFQLHPSGQLTLWDGYAFRRFDYLQGPG